jgi:hypothetical protein
VNGALSAVFSDVLVLPDSNSCVHVVSAIDDNSIGAYIFQLHSRQILHRNRQRKIMALFFSLKAVVRVRKIHNSLRV